jgi:hypothetical protein
LSLESPVFPHIHIYIYIYIPRPPPPPGPCSTISVLIWLSPCSFIGAVSAACCVLLPFSYFVVFLLTCCRLTRLSAILAVLPPVHLGSRFEQNFEILNSIDSKV